MSNFVGTLLSIFILFFFYFLMFSLILILLKFDNSYICPPGKSVMPRLKVTTDTNNRNSCMTKHILSFNFNICYPIYLKLIEMNGIGIPDAIVMN